MTRVLSGNHAVMPDAPDVQDWIFTFGFAQRPLRYVVVRGTLETSRERMLFRFGRAWSNQYASRERAGVEQYGLIEIDFVTGEDVKR